MFPTLNDVLGSRDVSYCRKSLEDWERYIASLYVMYSMKHSSTILTAYHNLIDALQKDLILIQEHTLNIEKENGCSYCGSQANEDCRFMDIYGCPSWEDYKEGEG